MANTILPPEERNLTPHQVVALDKRRHRGHLFLTLALLLGVVATLLLLWVGQDLVQSPGWIHPLAYFCATLYAACAGFVLAGIRLRRGHPEFN